MPSTPSASRLHSFRATTAILLLDSRVAIASVQDLVDNKQLAVPFERLPFFDPRMIGEDQALGLRAIKILKMTRLYLGSRIGHHSPFSKHPTHTTASRNWRAVTICVPAHAAGKSFALPVTK